MTAKQKTILSPENYLQQERLAEFKSEYYNGDIYAMAGASRNHNQITSNLVVSLGRQLAKLPCSVYSSDMKVRTNTADTSKYSYPDVVLSCDKELFEDDKGDVLLNPQIIIEVLSDSTEAYDRGLKFFHYQLIPSLQEYLLVSQHYCRVEHYQRRADKQWVYSEFHSMEDNIPLATLACSLMVSEIYRRVVWETS
jgi:Uma2 family endonuclease